MEKAIHFDLENGLRVIVAEDHAVPAAAFGMWVRAGVCDEPRNRRGIAHFFEHMMFRGSERFGPKVHTRRVSHLGGDCNASTGIDQTFYHETFPAHGLGEVIELEADRFMRLKLTEEHTEVECKVVLEELRLYENQPMSRAYRQIIRLIGGEHPYGLDPLGRKEDLEATHAADLQAFHRRLYRPGNVFAVICGDVRRAEVEELVRRHFGAWRDPQPAEEFPPVPPFKLSSGRVDARLSFEAPVVARVHRLHPSAAEDHAALDLLVALLADGQSAPVYEQMVKQRRLCVDAGCACLKLLKGGMLVFYGVFLPPGRHAPRFRALADICERIVQDGPPAEEFSRRIKRFRGNLANARYSVMSRLEGLGNAEMFEGGYARYESAIEDFNAVTPDRVREVARRVFAPENTLEFAITPEKSRWWMPLAGLAQKVIRR